MPEVETVVRGLAKILPGRRVLALSNVEAPITGETIQSVTRYGKFIVIAFPQGFLSVHLGMTGQLTVSEETSKFTRARIYLDQGILRYDDIRKFGRIRWEQTMPQRGPDPLELTSEAFVQLAKQRKARIKALLLDQKFLRGMGNIYTDEALFLARIHPLAQAAKLSRPRLAALHAAMQEVLSAAIAAGGSSISDYVDAHGEKGSFQQQHQVYAKAGQACPRCGTTLVRILVTQRGTTFCPACQKR